MRPRSPSARPPRRASDAHRRSSRLKDPSRIGNASTTGRTPPTGTEPLVSPARARHSCRIALAGRTATEGAGPGPVSYLSHIPLVVGLGGDSGRRPACYHAGDHRSRRRRRHTPGREQVFPERLLKLRARGGQLSPHHHRHSGRPRTSGYRRWPSYRRLRRGRHPRAGRRGPLRKVCLLDRAARTSTDPSRVRGALSGRSTT